jgi:cysteine synthase A
MVAVNVSPNILGAIGNTPLVELRRVVPEGAARVLAKIEWANPTGSMKDRMAVAAIEAAARRGDLKPGGTVVEYTAGTTGISLALVCAAQGYKIEIVSSDAFAPEKLRMIAALGGNVTRVKSEQKKITEKLIKEMIETSKVISRRPNHWACDQLNNRDAITGYYAMGEEIWEQSGGQVDALVHAVGTAHSIHGASHALRKHKPSLKVIAVEPAESAVLSGKPGGAHQIEGIGLGFAPPLFERDKVDEILTVSTSGAKNMARQLAREEGLFAGTSSGANAVAATEIAKRLGRGKTVVTIMVDSGLRYMSGDLYPALASAG